MSLQIQTFIEKLTSSAWERTVCIAVAVLQLCIGVLLQHNNLYVAFFSPHLKVQCVRFPNLLSGFNSFSSKLQLGVLDWVQMLLCHVSTVAWRVQTDLIFSVCWCQSAAIIGHFGRISASEHILNQGICRGACRVLCFQPLEADKSSTLDLWWLLISHLNWFESELWSLKMGDIVKMTIRALLRPQILSSRNRPRYQCVSLITCY